MSNETSEAGENVRQHLRRLLAQLRTLKEQQAGDPNSSKPDIAIEIDRDEGSSESVGGGESST
jgi:hypothetical protein